MEGETPDDYNSRYSSESTAQISFNDRTLYSDQSRESAISIMETNSYQPPESLSGPEDAIELSDHSEPQSEFLNTQSDICLASSRSKLDPGMIDPLGLKIIITNISAAILLTLSVSVLSFLWFGGEENKHWRRVVIDGWAGQAVTLSTLAIRISVSIQAGTAVAMLASVALESESLGGVFLPETPALSIARFVNTGPLGSLLYFAKHSQWTLSFSTLSISALAATTLVSQFTSTLLLWDIRQSAILGFPRQITTGIGMSMERFWNGHGNSYLQSSQNYWLAPPPNYPAFAEWGSTPLNSSKSIIDTGPSIRAFLPINSESDRSALLEYQGMASAFDARVTCIRPTIKDWSVIAGDNLYLNNNRFKGTLFPPRIIGDLADVLRHDIPPAGYSFEFGIEGLWVESDPTFMIHSLPRHAGGLINSLNPMQNRTLDYSYSDSDYSDEKKWFAQNKENGKRWEIELGHSFLILSAGPRGVVPDVDETLLDELFYKKTNIDFKVEERGPWLDFSRNSDREYQKGVMSVTMCYDAIYHERSGRVKGLQEFPVSAKRRSNYIEPKPSFDTKNGRFETMTVRAQLDTLQASSDGSAFVLDPTHLNETLRSFRWDPTEYDLFRGTTYEVLWYHDTKVYHFNDTANLIKEGNGPSETYDFLTYVVWKTLRSKDSNNTFEIFLTCSDCPRTSGDENEHIGSTVMNPVLNTMFVDIMKETDNPALTWQALVTTLIRMAYYDWLPTFDYMGNATVTSMVPCQKPQHHKGFIIVMANLLVHLVFVTVSSFLFFTRTRYSLLSNAWQAIAQMKAPETDLYLDTVTMLSDKKVKREIDREGARRRFIIKRNDEDDRVCLL